MSNTKDKGVSPPTSGHAVRLSMDRAAWIARNILPNERAIRGHLRRWRLPDDLDEDDVLQEIYSRFVAMADVEAIRSPRSYAISAARSIVLMHVRHSRVVSIRGVGDLASLAVAADEPSPEDQASDREQLHLLAVAVSELPETNRQAFLMRMIDEMPHRDIGIRLGISDNAVQKCIAKSLSLLLVRIGRGGNEPARASRLNDETAIPRRHVETRDEC